MIANDDDEMNVIAFAPRPQKPPSLEFVQLRLNTTTCAIEMTVVDEAGATVVLGYTLTHKPEGFDLARLVKAWEGWRGSTGLAS